MQKPIDEIKPFGQAVSNPGSQQDTSLSITEEVVKSNSIHDRDVNGLIEDDETPLLPENIEVSKVRPVIFDHKNTHLAISNQATEPLEDGTVPSNATKDEAPLETVEKDYLASGTVKTAADTQQELVPGPSADAKGGEASDAIQF